MSKQTRAGLTARLKALWQSRDDQDDHIHYEGSAIRRILRYMKPHLRTFCVCLLLVLIATGLEIWRPIIIGDAIDEFITGQTSQTVLSSGRTEWAAGEMADARFRGVLIASAKYLLALIGLFLCNRFQFLMMQRMGQDIIYDMRNEIFAHIESLTMRFFDTTPVGKLVTRATNDVESINEVFTDILIKLFRNAVKIVGLIIIMLALNARLALYSFVLLPVVMALTVIFRLISRKTYRMVRTRLFR